MSRPRGEMKSEIGWSNAKRIVLFGRDFPSEILGKISLGDMAFLEINHRLPTLNESKMFNALCVTLVEHGITPSAIVARMTYMGAPEAMQAAIAAGLSGLGSVFVGSTETSAKMLYEALGTDRQKATKVSDLQAVAKRVVADFRTRKQIVPGIGHPVHKPIDPRTPVLYALADETGFSGAYTTLMQLIATEAGLAAGGRIMPVNATGAIGSIACEMGLPVECIRGIGVLARAVGLVGHILEESRRPMSRELWLRTEEDATEAIRTAYLKKNNLKL